MSKETNEREMANVDAYQQYLINTLKPKYLDSFERHFKNVTAVGSDHVFELIDFYSDKVLLIDFYTRQGNHEQVISDLKVLIGDDDKCYDNIVYVDVNAELKYEFFHILYDLGLVNQPLMNFPYFLVLKGFDGEMFRGEDAAKMIYDQVMEFVNEL